MNGEMDGQLSIHIDRKMDTFTYRHALDLQIDRQMEGQIDRIDSCRCKKEGTWT
jgi:hypothetical protein